MTTQITNQWIEDLTSPRFNGELGLVQFTKGTYNEAEERFQSVYTTSRDGNPDHTIDFTLLIPDETVITRILIDANWVRQGQNQGDYAVEIKHNGSIIKRGQFLPANNGNTTGSETVIADNLQLVGGTLEFYGWIDSESASFGHLHYTSVILEGYGVNPMYWERFDPPEHDGDDDCDIIYRGASEPMSGNPISLWTGEKTERVTDIQVQTPVGPLSLMRTFRQEKLDEYTTPLGLGWTHNHIATLDTSVSGKIVVKMPNGGLAHFYQVGTTDRYEASAGSASWIDADGGTSDKYKLQTPNDITYTFDDQGRLRSKAWLTGEIWTYTYSGNQLQSVGDGYGRQLLFRYYTTGEHVGMLRFVGDQTFDDSQDANNPSGRYVEYRYAQEQLNGVVVTSPRSLLAEVYDVRQAEKALANKSPWIYRYFGQTSGETDARLANWLVQYDSPIVDQDGDMSNDSAITRKRLTYTLDANDEVSEIVEEMGQGIGSSSYAVTKTYRFDRAAGETEEDSEGQITTHFFTPNGLYWGYADPDGNLWQELVDSTYRPGASIDGNGNATEKRWTANGKLLTELWDAEDNVRRFEYDDRDRPKVVYDADGLGTLYLYEDQRDEVIESATHIYRVTGDNKLQNTDFESNLANWQEISGQEPFLVKTKPHLSDFVDEAIYVRPMGVNNTVSLGTRDTVLFQRNAGGTGYNFRFTARVYILKGTLTMAFYAPVDGVLYIAPSSIAKSAQDGWQTLTWEGTLTPSSQPANPFYEGQVVLSGGTDAIFFIDNLVARDLVTNNDVLTLDMSDAGSLTGAQHLGGSQVLPFMTSYLTNATSNQAAAHIVADSTDDGIEQNISVEADKDYLITAWVRPVTGSVKLTVSGSTSFVPSQVDTNEWELLTLHYRASTTGNVSIDIVVDQMPASPNQYVINYADFFVDDIQCYELVSDVFQRMSYTPKAKTESKEIVTLDDTVLKREEFTYVVSGNGAGLVESYTEIDLQNADDIITTITYDAVGRPIKRHRQSMFGDCEISFTVYDVDGTVAATICNYDPDGNPAPTTIAEATALYNLVGKSDKNDVTTYERDTLGRVQTVVTDAGSAFARVMRFIYDALDRPIRQVMNFKATNANGDPYEAPANWVWDETLQRWYDRSDAGTRLVIEHGNDLDENIIRDTAYNARGQVRLRRDHVGRVTLFGYDAIGDLIKVVDHALTPLDNNDYIGTDPDPDLSDYPAQTLVADGDRVTAIEYDRAHNPVKVVNPLGQTQYTVYDRNNRPIKVIRAAKNSATLALDEGDVGYDETNDPRSDAYEPSTAADRDLITSITYNAIGRPVRVSQLIDQLPSGSVEDVTLYGYNAQGWHVRTIYHATDPMYDWQTDRSLAAYSVSSDSDKDLIVEQVYDARGRITGRINPDGVENTIVYDGLDRPIKEIFNVTYDPLVDTIVPTDPLYKGDLTDSAADIITHMAYNSDGRLVKMRLPLAINTAGDDLTYNDMLYGYDSRGQVVRIVQNASDPDYVFNNEATDPTLASYQPVSASDQDVITTYVYDEEQRIQKTIDDRGNVTLYGYDAADRLIKLIRNASNEAYNVDNDDRLAAYTPVTPDPDQDLTLEWVFDLVGRREYQIDEQGRVQYFVYDALNRMRLMVTNYIDLGGVAYGHPNTWYWDGSRWVDDQATEILTGNENDQNLVTELTYDKLGNLRAIRDAYGTVTDLTYDQLNRAYQTTMASGSPIASTDYVHYNKIGQHLGVVRNLEVSLQPDWWEWVDLGSGTGKWQYIDPVSSNATDILHGAYNDQNLITQFAYDTAQRLAQVRNTDGSVMQMAYDPIGRLTALTTNDVVVDGVGSDVTKAYRYDALGRLRTVVENYVAPPSAIDPADWYWNGSEWHDTTAKVPNGNNDDQNLLVALTYDKSGRLLNQRDPLGRLTQYAYDRLARQVQLTNPLGTQWSTNYLDVGQTSRVTMGYPGVNNAPSYQVQRDIDRLGRLSSIDYNDATTTPQVNFNYDLSGNMTRITENNGQGISRQTDFSYDQIDRLSQVDIDRTGDAVTDETVLYSYDERGLRTSLQFDNVSVQYIYDEKGRLIELEDWNNQSAHFDYDQANRLRATQHVNAMHSAYRYDPVGYLQGAYHVGDNGLVAGYDYLIDAIGNRLQMRDLAIGSTTPAAHTFTSDDPLVQYQGSWSDGVTDDVTAKMSIVFHGLGSGQNELLELGQGPDAGIVEIYLDGVLLQTVDGYNVTETTQTIQLAIADTNSHILTIQNTAQKNAASTGYKLTFVSLAAQQMPFDMLEAVDYRYDGASRLLQADYTAQQRVFDYLYDLAGNRLQEAITAGGNTTTSSLQFDAANRITQMQLGGQMPLAFAYDPNGNLLSDGAKSYQWDRANRLLSVNGSSYGYDGLGNRINEVTNGRSIDYLLDMGLSLPQVLKAENLLDKTRYLHSPFGIYGQEKTVFDTSGTVWGVATWGNSDWGQDPVNSNAARWGSSQWGSFVWGQQQSSNGSTTVNWSYILPDGLNNVRNVVDDSQAVVESRRYTPYGEVLDQVGAQATFYGFTGEWTDPTGLIHLRARNYAPGLGNFLSRDLIAGNPMMPMSINRYAYVGGNPINRVDPTGLTWGRQTVTGLAQGGWNMAKDTARNVAISAYDRSMTISAYARMGLGMDPLDAGMTRAEALARAAAVTGLSMADVLTLGSGSDVYFGYCEGDYLRMVLGAVDFIPGAGKVIGWVGDGIGWAGKGLAKYGDEILDIARPYVDDALDLVTPYVDEAFDFAKKQVDDLTRQAREYVDDLFKRNPCASFSEDTIVATPAGDRPISEIQVGDEILAYNEDKGEVDVFQVLATHTQRHETTLDLTISGELVHTTDEHPFLVADDEELRWVEAGQLTIGDTVLSADGTIGSVEAVKVIPEPQTMYNLTVALAATYVVGSGQWVVHNADDLTLLQEAMQNLGIPQNYWNRFTTGKWVVFQRPSLGGDPIIALAQREINRLRSGILSINDRGTGTGLRDFANWRADTRRLATELQVDSYELFGASIINNEIDDMVDRLKFTSDTIQFPNDSELSILAGETIPIKCKTFPRS